MASHLFTGLIGATGDRERLFLTTPAGRAMTYGDLDDMSARLAATLLARGVLPGDRVAAQVEKSPEALALYLACLRAGAVFLPLNPSYTIAELDYFIADSSPRLVVCDPARRAALEAVAARAGAGLDTLDADGGGSLTDAAAAMPTNFADVPRGPDDLAAILYTSGTTGRSKGAILSHENLLSNARTLVDVWRFTADDVLLHALPIFHTHGLFVAGNVVLAAGASMLFLPRFDAHETLSLLPRATAMMGVPTFYTRLLQHPGLTHDATAHMRLFISGSAPLLAETHRAFHARTGHFILERYGMTETSMNTSNPYDGERIAGTVGLPLPGVRLRVVDADSGAPVAAGAVGMIEVDGPNVFRGYWRNPEKTKAEFRGGYFMTGDLGRIDARGYLHLVGRSKDLIISGGLNIYPKEVEEAIDALPGLAESAVIGVPHPDFGEAVTAIVVAGKNADVRPDAVIAALAESLAKFKIPKRVIVVPALPRNAMGKVQKNLLRERFSGLYG